MTEQTKQKLKYWFIGLFSGMAVATPVTALVTRKIDEKKQEEAYDRGMNDMAEYAANQAVCAEPGEESGKEAGSAEKAVFEPNRGIPEDDDINNYDVAIDDVEATEEVRDRAEDHAKYLEMIDKYNGCFDIQPYIIDGDKFVNEQYMEKSYINWYEDDNVFEEDLAAWDDPYQNVGVTNGADLFRHPENRIDADIVYVRNEKQTTDYEISRIHGSYAKMVGGQT